MTPDDFAPLVSLFLLIVAVWVPVVVAYRLIEDL